MWPRLQCCRIRVFHLCELEVPFFKNVPVPNHTNNLQKKKKKGFKYFSWFPLEMRKGWSPIRGMTGEASRLHEWHPRDYRLLTLYSLFLLWWVCVWCCPGTALKGSHLLKPMVLWAWFFTVTKYDAVLMILLFWIRISRWQYYFSPLSFYISKTFFPSSWW